MNLTILNQTPHRNLQRGGISVGGLLMICVVILLAALGITGYRLYQANSGKLDADAKRLAAEEALQREKARTTAAEAAKTKQERENRLAIAQSLRDSFAARAGIVTNALHGLLDRIPLVEQELSEFRTGPKGVQVTKFPDLVEASGTFFTAKLNLPKRNIGISHLEGIRLILIRNAENRGTETQPSPDAEKIIDEARLWADSAESELSKTTAFIKSTIEAAASKYDDGKSKVSASLDQAIEAARISAALAIEKARNEARKAAEKIEEEQANLNTVEAGKRRAQQLEEDNARKQREAAAAIAKQKLIEEAKSASIQNLLAPVLTSGNVDCDGRLSEPGPLSWRQLSSKMASKDSLKNLHHVFSNNRDTVRPRLPKVDLTRDQNTYNRVVEMRRALEKLGPTLVELKMLNP
jgi:hypothetical protein